MNKNFAFFYVILLMVSLLFSCDRGNLNKEFGQYAVAINYNGDDFVELHFSIDGKGCGKLVPVPKVNPSYVEDCKMLGEPDQLTNIFVLQEIPVGKHLLEIKTDGGSVIKVLEFEMLDRECVFQEADIAFD